MENLKYIFANYDLDFLTIEKQSREITYSKDLLNITFTPTAHVLGTEEKLIVKHGEIRPEMYRYDGVALYATAPILFSIIIDLHNKLQAKEGV